MPCNFVNGLKKLKFGEDLNAQLLAAQIKERLGTDDIFLIADAAGLKIVYERWFPVTAGEFYPETKSILVNLSSQFSREKIVAHEFGHYLLGESEIEKIADRERFCDEFAAEFQKADEK